MARLITAGAELQDVGLWGNTGHPPEGRRASVTIDTTNPRSGAACFKCSGNAAASTMTWFNSDTDYGLASTVAGRSYFHRVCAFWNATNTPVVGTWIMSIEAAGAAANAWQIRVETVSGTTLTFALYAAENGVTTKLATFAGSYASTYHIFEIRLNVASSTSVTVEARVDLTDTSGSFSRTITGGSTTGPSAFSAGKGDTTAGLVDLYIDDCAVNDDQGASQNTWVGDSKLVLLIPTGDSAKGTGWTNDAAATTNLFDAVNNEPPAGIADTTAGSGLHQIRNATSNANVNYDANLTTYAAAGIGASDTINVLIPIVATAAPVTTSAKAGTFGVVSNPAIANVNLGPDGTSGTFWSGTAAGTYPSGWKWSYGTTTYAPTVTKGTAPVARITQVTASTRIAMVAFMGMYVDYTPAAVAVTVTPPRPTVILQAVSRASSW